MSPRATSCACSRTASCWWRLAGHPLCQFGRAVAEPPRRARDRRRPGAVSVRGLDAREHARERRRPEDDAGPAEGGGGRGAAAGALRGSRAFLCRRHSALRLRLAPILRLPHGGRAARGRPRDRRWHLACARRADRGLPDRPGGTRERAQARRCTPRLVRIAEQVGERFVTVVDDGAGFDEEEIAAGQGRRTCGPARPRSAAASGSSRLRDAAPRSKSCSAHSSNWRTLQPDLLFVRDEEGLGLRGSLHGRALVACCGVAHGGNTRSCTPASRARAPSGSSVRAASATEASGRSTGPSRHAEREGARIVRAARRARPDRPRGADGSARRTRRRGGEGRTGPHRSRRLEQLNGC